jgi:hypothetical protein
LQRLRGACEGPRVSDARGGACGGASGGRGGPGASGARGSVCRGAKGNGGVQGPGDARDGAVGGAHVDCDEGRADRRVGVPTAVPTVAPVAAAAPTEGSREAAAA